MNNEHQTPEAPSQGFLGETPADLPIGADPIEILEQPAVPSDQPSVEEVLFSMPEEPDLVEEEPLPPPNDETVTEEPVVADADADEDVEVAAILIRKGKNPNAEMTTSPYAAIPKKRIFRDGEALPILMVTNQELNDLLSHYKNIDPTTSQQGRDWAMAVNAGRELIPRGDVGLDALTRDGSLWRQTLRVGAPGSLELEAGTPKIFDREGEGQIAGDDAVRYMNMVLGRGRDVRVPLWHSGIWVTFRTPSEQEQLELDRRIAGEKILLGRVTNGLAYANTSVYHNSFLFNFALSMVTDSSLPNSSLESLKATIQAPDFPLLLWGLLTTIYPNGYRYLRPCVNDPSKCVHTVEELLDLNKLAWVDNSVFSESQRKQMQRRAAKFSPESLSAYQNSFAKLNELGTLILKENSQFRTVVELRVPTLADWEISGFSWVDSIVAKTDAAFGSQINGDQRNQYILDSASTTSMRQYAHWVKRITITDLKSKKQRVIEDRQTLENAVGVLTGDSTAHDVFFEGMRDYINASTFALIAVPRYPCPVCEKDQGESVAHETLTHPHLIPLEMSTLFFTLLDQRVSLLLAAATM